MTDHIQTDDIFVFQGTAENGFDFVEDGDTLTIAQGVLVGSADMSGVSTTYNSNVLVNNGLVSGYYEAVAWHGIGGSLTNNLGASLIGQQVGINTNNDSNDITNHGSISGLLYEGVYFGESADDCTLDNDGDIFGHEMGVGVFGSGETINNTGSGFIRSDKYGIHVDGHATTIYNSAEATISGSLASIHTGGVGGSISLNNFGRLVGSIKCTITDASDVIVNRGTISGGVDLGSGNDTFKDLGLGMATGAIHAGAGLDDLVAGKAREVFFGEAGADKFVFNSSIFSPATAARDTVRDFSHLEGDKIDLHAMDADKVHAGLQHFVFIGGDSFAHYHSLHPNAIGMVRFDAAHERLEGNVNSDYSHADFQLALPTVTAVQSGDLILA